MNKLLKITMLVYFTTIVFGVYAQYPATVKTFESKPNAVTEIKGNLANGKSMDDLSWASTSSMACFPATQNTKFRGNHVLFATQIPPYSEMTVTVIPDSKTANMSIYGYQVGTSNYALPPDIGSCVSCEAEHKWDYQKSGKTQDHTRSIYFNSIEGSYNIVIGVAGAEGLKAGTFTIKVDLKTRVENTSTQESLKMYTATSQKGATKSYKGNLKDGVKIHDLSWASKSSVACFPGTQNSKFTGNHILYITELPANSEMDIQLVPTNKSANMSLYAYQVGTNDKQYPPALSTCTTCEADHKWDYPKHGKTQDHTRSVSVNSMNSSYKIVIGVAGAEELTTGEFVLKITVK